MSTLPPCPQCQSEYSYEDGNLLICPSCGPMQLKSEFVKKA